MKLLDLGGNFLVNDNNILSKENIKKLLEKIFKKEIIEINIKGIEHFESIIEYNFSLTKVNVTYKNNQKDELFLRIIKGGKIKESIFCYWSYLYEEYLKNKKIENENTIQKSIITQIESPRNISNLLLTIDSKLNYCAEISLVELKKYFEEERWVGELEINNTILFIAKKMY